MITVEILHAIAPFTKLDVLNTFVSSLNAAMDEFAINTSQRVRMFLAQCGHESQGFARLEENLNYSASGLIATWPKRFDAVIANQYARQPGRIANRAYANRMGNGDELSGDGWKYRGAGLIQTTGKTNHLKMAAHFGIDPEGVGDWLRKPEGASMSAALFWGDSGCNMEADAGDFTAVTKIINGGVNGLEDRLAYLNRAKAVI